MSHEKLNHEAIIKWLKTHLVNDRQAEIQLEEVHEISIDEYLHICKKGKRNLL